MLSPSKHLYRACQSICAAPVKTFMLSPSKYTKKNLRNLLHLRKSARREATTHRAKAESNRVETKTNRAQLKSNRAETDLLCAIKFFFCGILSFF